MTEQEMLKQLQEIIDHWSDRENYVRPETIISDLAARGLIICASESVAWRPRWAGSTVSNFNYGQPDQQSIEYFTTHAHGVEYAYVAPGETK